MNQKQFFPSHSLTTFTIRSISTTGIPRFIVLHFTALQILFLFINKLKVCENPMSSKSISAIFTTAFAHVMCVSRFGNFHSISGFLIIAFVR